MVDLWILFKQYKPKTTKRLITQHFLKKITHKLLLYWKKYKIKIKIEHNINNNNNNVNNNIKETSN